MKRVGASRTCAAGVAAATLLLLGGCGDDAGDPGDASAGTAAREVTSTPSPTPGVEPATGPRLAVDGVSLRAPEGWEETEQWVPNTRDAATPDSAQLVSITSPRIDVGDMSLDEVVANMRRDRYRVLEPIEVAGQTFARGIRREGARREDVHLHLVSVVDGHQVGLGFWFDPEVTREERQATLDAVLATVDLS